MEKTYIKSRIIFKARKSGLRNYKISDHQVNIAKHFVKKHGDFDVSVYRSLLVVVRAQRMPNIQPQIVLLQAI